MLFVVYDDDVMFVVLFVLIVCLLLVKGLSVGFVLIVWCSCLIMVY